MLSARVLMLTLLRFHERHLFTIASFFFLAEFVFCLLCCGVCHLLMFVVDISDVEWQIPHSLHTVYQKTLLVYLPVIQKNLLIFGACYLCCLSAVSCTFEVSRLSFFPLNVAFILWHRNCVHALPYSI